MGAEHWRTQQEHFGIAHDLLWEKAQTGKGKDLLDQEVMLQKNRWIMAVPL